MGNRVITNNGYFEKPDYQQTRWDIPTNANWDEADSQLIVRPTNNLIYNPLFEVNQRGITTKNDNGYFIDRWRQEHYGGVSLTTTLEDKMVGQELPPTKTGKLLRVQTDASSGASGDYGIIEQRIPDLWKFQRRDVTFSFWALANGSDQDIRVSFAYFDGSSVDWGSEIVQVFTISSSSYQKYSVSFSLADIVGYTLAPGHHLRISIYMNTGALDYINKDIYFSNFELVYGNRAVDTITRTFSEELALCQRFFWAWNNTGGAKTSFGIGMSYDNGVSLCISKLPVQMRKTPTITVSDVSHFFIYGPNANPDSISGYAFETSTDHTTMSIEHSSLTKGDTIILRSDSEDARIFFDAEL